jgi:hypothetical protein
MAPSSSKEHAIGRRHRVDPGRQQRLHGFGELLGSTVTCREDELPEEERVAAGASGE